ncbi:hypothetical protein HanRHA438_Chr08g0342781 [Helianthus annuus]|nr:hypothetical protein HanRHA438_Chr08g0342781 [Helianthus annuus]
MLKIPRPNTASEPNTHVKSSDMALSAFCIIEFSWSSGRTSNSDLMAAYLTKEDEDREVKPEERSVTQSSRSDEVIEVTGATELP